MARKRIIDPEFWSDEEVGRWSFEARLFYIALWNFADDEGRFKAHPSLLKSQVFPYDTKIDIDKLKSEISSKIQWYGNNGSQYGHVRNFLKHQRIDRPTVSKLPSPKQFDEASTKSIEPSTNVPPNISKGNIREVNIIPTQVADLLAKFLPTSQEKIKVYIERVRQNNKSKVITEGRKLTLLTELYNTRGRCNDDELFNYALEAAIGYNAPNIGYVNAVIKNKKIKK